MPTDVVGRRIAAIIIDGIVLFVISAVVLLILEGLGLDVLSLDSDVGDADFSFSATETFGGTLISAGLALLYKVYQEGKYNGQTLGKRALGIRAVQAISGSPITMEQAFIRGIFWQAPFTLSGLGGLFAIIGFFWLLAGLIALITSPTRQRIGDRVAGTVVIRDNPLAQTYTPQPRPQQTVTPPQFAPPSSTTEVFLTCSYCKSRFPRSKALQSVWQGRPVINCPNCGAPVEEAN